VETIIYLAYEQNCLLECSSTYVAEREGKEASGKEYKRPVRSIGEQSRMVIKQRERESHV
jgi:hypothetical protein